MFLLLGEIIEIQGFNPLLRRGQGWVCSDDLTHPHPSQEGIKKNDLINFKQPFSVCKRM
jgi:hypothetical protein